MKLLIIEDETQAALRLKNLVLSLVPDAVILQTIDSVTGAVRWFKNNPPPDVVLMDVQLADGISFRIFEECDVAAPVIFTTAYDTYALRAFKVNSIDYILKPVDKDELAAALLKARNRHSHADNSQLIRNIGDAVRMLTRKFKTRFVIKVGEHLRTIEIKDIFYFLSQEKTTFCVTAENRSLVLDYTLEQLEEMLDPAEFFRINRKYLVRASAIQDIISHANSRLKLKLRGSEDRDIIVSRERVHDFREWLDR